MNQFVYAQSSRNPFDDWEVRYELLKHIDQIAGLRDARIMYFDGFEIHEIRPHPPVCQESYLTVVIRAVPPEEVHKVATPAKQIKQDNRFFSELLSTSLSCGAAALSWIVVGGSGAAVPVTGGTSSVITVLSYSAATASSIQCANSMVRLYNESDYGSPENNRWLDSQDWYVHTMTALDVISVAGATAATGATIKMALRLEKAGQPMKEVLKGLNRQQRRLLTRELVRASNPKMSNRAIKAMVAAGKLPKRFGKMELSNTVRLQLKDAAGAALSFTGSATSGVIRDPSAIPNIAIAVIEEFEVY